MRPESSGCCYLPHKSQTEPELPWLRLRTRTMRMLGLEDPYDFHRLRLHDDNLGADLKIFIPTPCWLDINYRLRKRSQVNRTGHNRAGRQTEADVVPFRSCRF